MQPSSIKYHNTLAQYYQSQPLWFDNKMAEPNARKCVELPWQQTEAELWNETVNTLCDIIFIEANAKSDLLDSLKALYEYALLQINDKKNREKLNAYYTVFLRQRYIIQEYPASTFQQIYNEIQWFDQFAKNHLDKNKETYTASGGTFLHQYRVPKLVGSHLVFNLTAHNGSVNAVQFSPDGNRFVSASSDATIKIWDAEFCNEIATLAGHGYMINSCAFSKDGRKIISASVDKTIKIWDAITYKEIATLHGHNKPVIACAFSSDGNRVVSVSSDDFIKIWDAKKAVEILNIEATGYFITSCTFSPDGKHILTGSKEKASQIWNAETGEQLFNLTSNQKEKPALHLEQFKGLNAKGVSDINCCNYSPDGRYIVAGKFAHLVVFDATDGKEIVSFRGHDKAINSCAFSANSKMIVSGSDDHTVKVWNIATGKEIVCFVGHTSAVISCNFSPDGKHVISGSRDKTIKYWSLEPALETLNHGAHHSQIDLCQFTPLGSLILTRDKDNAIKLYDPETGSLITDIINDGGDFTHKGKNFKYKSWNCSGGQKIIKIWDIKTNETLFTLPSDFFAFSPDYKNFVAGHEEVHGSADEYNIKIHKTDSNENDYVTWRSDSFITSYSYSPDGKTIATSNDHRPLSIHDAITGKLIKSFQDLGKPVKCCSFSPDGQQIVTGNNERQIETMYDKLIKRKKDVNLMVWDIKYDNPILSLIGHTDTVLTCCFSPDGNLIASGSADNTLKIWQTKTGKVLSTFHAHSGVTSCAFHPDGTKLAFGDASGNFYLVNLVGFKHEPPIITARFTFEEHNDELIEKTLVVCPYCQTSLLCRIPSDATFDDSRLSINCPECNMKLKLNPFTVEID